MSRKDPCSNVQNEFGEGCYRSGDIFFIYCTPFSNQLLNERCNGNVSPDRGDRDCDRDNVSPDSGNRECRRRCEREGNECRRDCDRRERECNRRCDRVSPDSGNRRCCRCCCSPCRCNCRNSENGSAFVGGDFGNCFY